MIGRKARVRRKSVDDAAERAVFLGGSSFLTGSRIVPSEEVDRAFGMPVGKLRTRAGIESLAYAADGETELSMGARATHQAMRMAGCAPGEIDAIVATSETHH